MIIWHKIVVTVLVVPFFWGTTILNFPQKVAPTNNVSDNMILLAKGNYEMGDHHNLGGAEHRNDEVPVHLVSIDSFYINRYETTNIQYVEFLNASFTNKEIEIKDGAVFIKDGSEILTEIIPAVDYNPIGFNNGDFIMSDKKEYHPVVGVRWLGAIAYCNWLSKKEGLGECYDLKTGNCDFAKNGYRLPTEAEWEFAGRGGQYNPYQVYPYGDQPDLTKGNFPNSGDPFEYGDGPQTTPVGFFNNNKHYKKDFGWNSELSDYQTSDGANGFGLYDMAGNVWEWCNDWYSRDYYAKSPRNNPKGPETGNPMRDGLPYHVLRSGNWYNGRREDPGHSRVSNRNPGYYRGPKDPNHPYYHIGFRVARNFQ